MNCAVHTDIPAAAFCRNCGKALCENCKRDVMGAIYCEPCIAARLQTPVQPVMAVSTVAGAPNPGVAAFLGFIPGVGAMYNGQFAKAFIHVVIFALLIIGASEIHWFFGFMIPFFVFYMAFEAFKTAQAKQFGLPSPDPLGIEKLFGLQESQPAAAAGAAMPNAAAPGAAQDAQAYVVSGTGGATSSMPAPAAPQDILSGLPTGAVVLIVLGMFFLLGNLHVIRLRIIGPVFLIGLGLWIAFKRTMQRG